MFKKCIVWIINMNVVDVRLEINEIIKVVIYEVLNFF